MKMNNLSKASYPKFFYTLIIFSLFKLNLTYASSPTLFCEGGLMTPRFTYTVFLDQTSTTQTTTETSETYTGSIDTEKGSIIFTSEYTYRPQPPSESNTNFINLKIFDTQNNNIILNESSKQIPIESHITLPGSNETFFIKCRKYKPADFCRNHTC